MALVCLTFFLFSILQSIRWRNEKVTLFDFHLCFADGDSTLYLNWIIIFEISYLPLLCSSLLFVLHIFSVLYLVLNIPSSLFLLSFYLPGTAFLLLAPAASWPLNINFISTFMFRFLNVLSAKTPLTFISVYLGNSAFVCLSFDELPVLVEPPLLSGVDPVLSCPVLCSALSVWMEQCASTASLLASVREQERQFEMLSRALEEERRSCAGTLPRPLPNMQVTRNDPLNISFHPFSLKKVSWILHWSDWVP